MMSQLLEEILSQDNMILAYKKVKANRGTSGIDGIGVDEIDELVLCQEKVQIKYALLMLSYPAKASALSSNAA